MIKTISFYFILFIIYSFIGWSIEVVGKLIEKKRFINRGFLIGPICPIYGYGCLAIILSLNNYKNNLIILFCMAILICSILEYFTSYLMEKLFKARWWDYSRRKFNINGRICAETMIPFGILGCLIVHYINPTFANILNNFSDKFIMFTSAIMFIIFIIDNILSFKVITSFKNTIKKLEKDNTEEITKKVKELLLSKGILSRRLIKAFPNLIEHKDRLLEIHKRLTQEIKKIGQINK